MARTVTLGKLRGLARLYADQRPADETKAFVNAAGTTTTAGLNDLVNLALCELYDTLVKAGGADYYRTTVPINIVAGTSAYGIASDFYQLLDVRLEWATNDVEPVQSIKDRDYFKFLNANNWGSWGPKGYRVVQTNIEFLPKPTSAVTARIAYVPACPVLVNDSDTFDGINGWEKLVALKVAMELRAIEQTGFSDLQGLYEMEKSRIEGMAGDRAAEPDSVTDVIPEAFTGAAAWPYVGGRVTV